MKKLIVINGTMGVGKSTVCRELTKLLTPCAWLDGDWCWMMNPFAVDDENITMVTDNICHLLRGFLQNSHFEYVIFCWVIHEKAILDELLAQLGDLDYSLSVITLSASPEALQTRLLRDVSAGLRDESIVARSLARLPLYASMDTFHLDVSDRSAADAACQIAALVKTE